MGQSAAAVEHATARADPTVRHDHHGRRRLPAARVARPAASAVIPAAAQAVSNDAMTACLEASPGMKETAVAPGTGPGQ